MQNTVLKISEKEAEELLKEGSRFKHPMFDEFRDNKKVVLMAVRYDLFAAQSISKRLLNDVDVAMQSVCNYGINIFDFSPEIQRNIDIACLAVAKDFLTLEYLEPVMKNNYRVVLHAYQNDPKSVFFMTDEMQTKLKTFGSPIGIVSSLQKAINSGEQGIFIPPETEMKSDKPTMSEAERIAIEMRKEFSSKSSRGQRQSYSI